MLKDLLKKEKIFYPLFCYIRNKIFFIRVKKEYLKADEISLVINDKKSKEKYLILEYSGKSGLMTQMIIVLGWIKYADENGYILIVDMTKGFNMYKTGSENAWEVFFNQPYIKKNFSAENIDKIKKIKNYAVCNVKTRLSYKFLSYGEKLLEKYPPKILFPTPRDFLLNKSLHKEWEKIFQNYVSFSADAKKYLQQEYETVLKDKKKVLGVLVRGTDYNATKPYKHPIQPSANEVVEYIKNNYDFLDFDFIYLATDEYKTQKLFEETFPNKILINKRVYYDSKGSWLCDVRNDRENDSLLRGLEYLSSINLISKCDKFVGGLNGGTQASLIMNNSKYKFVYLFDFGDYN